VFYIILPLGLVVGLGVWVWNRYKQTTGASATTISDAGVKWRNEVNDFDDSLDDSPDDDDREEATSDLHNPLTCYVCGEFLDGDDVGPICIACQDYTDELSDDSGDDEDEDGEMDLSDEYEEDD